MRSTTGASATPSRQTPPGPRQPCRSNLLRPTFRFSMSALSQKQTLRHDRVMSVIPLKADIRRRIERVCFVPKADITSASMHSHLVRRTRYWISRFWPVFHCSSVISSTSSPAAAPANRRKRELAVAKSAEPRGRAFPISTETASRAPWRQVCERAVSWPLMTLADVLGV